MSTLPSAPRGLLPAAAVLGVGLGGFFDGILLHQVLQWHHLLSLVPGEALRDIGNQILADGLFHVLMYAVTAAGLWLLWRRRAALREAGAAKRVLGGALLGFGGWNIADVGLFHWIMGIHRIRVDVPDPLVWDIGWLVIFGLAVAAAGLLVLKRGAATGAGGRAAGAILSLLVLAAAPLAALPIPGSTSALVLLGPGARQGATINALLAADGRILWIDPAGRMMAVALDPNAATSGLYRAGALLVTRSPMLAGCAAALRATA
jgi:uncharacterized membrane protein